MRVRAEQKQRSTQKREVNESRGAEVEEREREGAEQKQGVGKYGGGRGREPADMVVIRLPT